MRIHKSWGPDCLGLVRYRIDGGPYRSIFFCTLDKHTQKVFKFIIKRTRTRTRYSFTPSLI